jgi:hypothetical protein
MLQELSNMLVLPGMAAPGHPGGNHVESKVAHSEMRCERPSTGAQTIRSWLDNSACLVKPVEDAPAVEPGPRAAAPAARAARPAMEAAGLGGHWAPAIVLLFERRLLAGAADAEGATNPRQHSDRRMCMTRSQS